MLFVLACEFVRVVVILMVDSGFWLVLPLNVGLELAKPC